MFRPLTFICVCVAAFAGYYLYQVKQSVAQLERELRDVRRQTEAALERTQVLRAEWALLNEPDRLRQVVSRHLALEPMTPAQFVRFSDLPRRVGAPQLFAGTPSLFAIPAPREPAVAAPVTVVAAASVPAPAPAPAARPAVAAPPPVAAPRAEPEQAAATPAPRPVGRAAAAPRPQAPPAPIATAAAPRPAVQPPAPPAPAVIATASSTLGFGRPALPPPVPFGTARAATTQ